MNAIVNERRKHVIIGGVVAMNTKVEGSKQFVLGNSDLQSRGNSAYSSVISGKMKFEGNRMYMIMGKLGLQRLCKKGNKIFIKCK
ncbi:hypothetical protein BWD162_003600 [Bartonella sp. WD16.2]|nr:hypothetical protein BWD162_003600 [Bartonella sp. WD16.2]